MRLAASRPISTAGSSRPMSTPMMVITTRTSTNVKAPRHRRWIGSFLLMSGMEKALLKDQRGNGPDLSPAGAARRQVGRSHGLRDIPDSDGTVLAGGSNPLPVGAERHAVDPAQVASQGVY